MLKLPRSIRFFRKPDHISFLVGYVFVIGFVFTNLFELKIMSLIGFGFTLCYELFEISKGNRDFIKLDHFTFVIGFVLLVLSIFVENNFLLLMIIVLFTFTLIYEIYRVRKNDLKNKNKS